MEKIDFVNARRPAINDINLNKMQDNIETAINAQVSGDTLPLGAMIPFPGGTIPDNYLLCDGSAVSRTTYSLLFNVIGTTYGKGDGSTTFNLPDMRLRTLVGVDTRDSNLNAVGKTYGEKKHTMTVDELVRHRHGITPRNTDQTGLYEIRATNATGTTGSAFTDYTGNGQPFNVMQPSMATNYIIKAFQTAGVVAEVVNEYSTSTTNVYSASYMNNDFIKMFNVNFTVGVLSPYQDKYDQSYTIPTTDIPSNYTPIGIIGEQLYGSYFSHCSFTTLYVANRVINWGIKNNTDVATGSLGCNAKILAIKTGT